MSAVKDVNDVLISSLAYDILNNRTSKTEGGTALYYKYDAVNQLSEIHSGSLAGPLLSSLSYDTNGNLTSRTDSGTTSTTSTTSTLLYDNLNQLAQVDKTGLPSETYGYDDSGRRVRKAVGGATSYYVLSADDILAEYASGWTTATASYTQGLGADDPFLRVAGANKQFYHQDGLGSVIATTDSSGAVPGTQRFDAWGNVAATSGTAISQYGYTGREPDASGLMYYRARYYSPDLGRFTQRDPIGLAGGINDYGYVGGNPVNFTDPLGLLGSCPAGSDSFIASILPDGAPIVTIGNALGGVGAYVSGKITGNEALVDAASQGLAETRAENVDALILLGTMGRGSGAKTYQTYTRTNPVTGEVYSGRTSGIGTPQQNVDLRNASSPLNERGFNDALLDRSSSNAGAIRGREQQLVDQFGGPQSQGGTSANKINGIAPANPNRQNYFDKALQEFGKLFGP